MVAIERNIGIVGDGGTDRAIFKKLAEVLLSENNSSNVTWNYFELIRQHELRTRVDEYWRKATKVNEYYLPSPHAEQLQKEAVNIISGAFTDFEVELGINNISSTDILLITTDAERTLSQPEDYFQDWAFSISKLLTGATDKFYSIKSKQGYTWEYLPLVISIVTFPSTEILVAAAKNLPNAKKYGIKPSDLKNSLYGTTNLSTITEAELKEKALDFITPDSIELIYRDVPESRIFIQTLSATKSF
jgi:hypothetical protein